MKIKSLSEDRTASLLDEALNLRESINSTRARLFLQRSQLQKLSSEIASLQTIGKNQICGEAQEPATEAGCSNLWRQIPYALLLAIAIAFHQRSLTPFAEHTAPATETKSPLATSTDEDGSAEALMRVCEWRLPGDERTLGERLGSTLDLPGAQPAWSVERTGDRVYRVSFHERSQVAGYDFDVDLDTGQVDPTPDTAPLLSAPLTALN